MKVKICGITRPEDAALAGELGADFVGLNFWPGSKRFVSVDEGRDIAEALPPGVAKVGVFVDASADDIEHVVMQVRLDFVQLHGDEPVALDLALSAPVIRAIRIASAADVARAAEHGAAWAVLLDAASAGYGGTGRTFEWSLATAVRASRVFIAGGLTPDNVAEAVRVARPFAVDVAGGVESAPGIKDPELMRRFIATAKGLPC